MTLLRVYNGNGHDVSTATPEYRYSNLMQDFFGENVGWNYSSPKVNITEDNSSFTIFMALPGVQKSEVDINVEKDRLTVSRRTEKDQNETLNYSRREFDYGSFERSFNLPEVIHVEKIEASMENGILKLVLPKIEEAIDKGPVQIKIS